MAASCPTRAPGALIRSHRTSPVQFTNRFPRHRRTHSWLEAGPPRHIHRHLEGYGPNGSIGDGLSRPRFGPNASGGELFTVGSSRGVRATPRSNRASPFAAFALHLLRVDHECPERDTRFPVVNNSASSTGPCSAAAASQMCTAATPRRRPSTLSPASSPPPPAIFRPPPRILLRAAGALRATQSRGREEIITSPTRSHFERRARGRLAFSFPAGTVYSGFHVIVRALPLVVAALHHTISGVSVSSGLVSESPQPT